MSGRHVIAETDAQGFASQYFAYAPDIVSEITKALAAPRTNPGHQPRYADFVTAMVYGEKPGFDRALAIVIALAEPTWPLPLSISVLRHTCSLPIASSAILNFYCR